VSVPAYTNYTDSGVAWLGAVPSHWEVATLKRRARLVSLRADQRTFPVALENIESWTGRFLPTETEFEGDGVAFEAGDILYGKLRPYLAKTLVVEVSGEAIGDFHVLRPIDQHPEYLGYLLRAKEIVSVVDGSTYGSKMPRASWDFLGSVVVAFPPFDEQSAIAAFLDRETAKIDALVTEQEQLIALLKEKRQAVISHAVTKGLNPNAPMKDGGIEWLGQIPAHWSTLPLKAVSMGEGTVFIDGDWIESKDIAEDGIRYITTGNVGEGIYKEQGSGFISDETFKALNCTEVMPGDVLISRLNLPIGRACIVPDLGARIVTSVDNVIVRTGDHVNRAYLTLLLSAKSFFAHTETLARGTTMQRISRTVLGNIRICLPAVEEQAEIAEYLREQTGKLDALMAEAQSAITLLQERRAALISAAVTGKIDVRGLAATSQELELA
jgi:type I restriction enzyme S subunit